MIFESTNHHFRLLSMINKEVHNATCVSRESDSSTHAHIDVCSDPPSLSQKTLRFYSAVQPDTGPGVMDLSQDERHSYWYSNEELEDIGCEAVATVELMDINAFIEDEDHCSRGLESKTQRAIERVSQNRAVVFTAIARESFLRKYYGDNAAGVRSSCWEIYAYDEEAAHLRAVVDEEEAFRIFLEDAAIASKDATISPLQRSPLVDVKTAETHELCTHTP